MSTIDNPTPPGARRPYKVFVSSTYLDNKSRRKLVQDAVTMAEMVWHGMDLFTASTRPTVEECLRYVREADLLIGIIAWRYGWEPGGEKSITEMEYDAAEERLMFVPDPSLPVNPEKDFDPGPDKWDKRKKLQAFKERFFQDQMPALFNESTLQAKVLQALIDWREQREQKPDEELPVHEPIPSAIHEELEDEIRRYCRKADSLHATLPVGPSPLPPAL